MTYSDKSKDPIYTSYYLGATMQEEFICRNCGASLKKSKCKYCGTDYKIVFVSHEEFYKILSFGILFQHGIACIWGHKIIIDPDLTGIRYPGYDLSFVKKIIDTDNQI